MIYVDLKYIGMLSNRLRNFKRKTDYTWNFSCPFCGDSTKNKLKARGYIYRVTSNLFFRCHNCDHGTNLGGVIKQVDPSLYNEYVVVAHAVIDRRPPLSLWDGAERPP